MLAARRRHAGGVVSLSVLAPKTASRLAVGESVAVNGVCLSVVGVGQGRFEFELIPETRHLTTLGRLAAGSRVHVEPSLALSDRLNGHLVLGHVDGVGRIRRVRRQAGDVRLEIAVNRAWRRLIAPKGPIAVDGVSLTVGGRVSAGGFSIFLIPETLQKTTLGSRRAGDRVNIELDYFSKLAAQWARR